MAVVVVITSRSASMSDKLLKRVWKIKYANTMTPFRNAAMDTPRIQIKINVYRSVSIIASMAIAHCRMCALAMMDMNQRQTNQMCE